MAELTLEDRKKVTAKKEAKLSPAEADRYEADNARLLFKLCRELQRKAGDKLFFLSCATVESLIGLQRMQASRYLNRLVMEGTLQVIEKHTASRATRYRFLSPIEPAAASLATSGTAQPLPQEQIPPAATAAAANGQEQRQHERQVPPSEA